MVIALPIIKKGKKKYFFDDRLKELRNVYDIDDIIKLTDHEVMVLRAFHKKKQL